MSTFNDDLLGKVRVTVDGVPHIGTIEHRDEPGPVVRWMNGVTGEIKERPWSGTDRGWLVDHDADGSPLAGQYYENKWGPISALEQALALVPDLEAAIDAAHMAGCSIEIVVKDWRS